MFVKYQAHPPKDYGGIYNSLNARIGRGILAALFLALLALTYYLRFEPSIPTFLTIAGAPILLITCWVTFTELALVIRVLANWILVGLFVLFEFTEASGHEMASWVVLACFVSFFAYCLAAGVVWSARFWTHNRVYGGVPSADKLAFLISLWSLTLQVTALFGFLLLPYLARSFYETENGQALGQIFERVQHTSLSHILPLSLFLLTLVLMAIFKLKEEPFRATSRLIDRPANPVMANLVAMMELFPLLAVNFARLGYHMATLLLKVAGEVLSFWLARLMYIISHLLMGPLLLFFGHWLSYEVVKSIFDFRQDKWAGVELSNMIWLHIGALFVFFAYGLAVILMATRGSGSSPKEFVVSYWRQLSFKLKAPGLPVVEGYSLFVFVIFTVPIASADLGFGLFSQLYTGIIVLVLIFAFIRQKFSKRSH